MIIEIGKHVKCLLVNNSVAEGIVEEWGEQLVKLKSIDGESAIIIHHPERDIMLTKIVLSETIVKESKTETVQLEEDNDLEKKFIEEYNKPSSDDLRIQNLAKLKTLLSKQEKEIISKKLKEHTVEEVRTVKYGNPQFLTLPGSK